MKSILSQLSNKSRKPLANLAVGLDPDEVRRLTSQPLKEKAHQAIGTDADEIKRLVEEGRKNGTIRAAGEAWSIEKDGLDAAELGAVKSQWMKVTPAMAKKWLDNNFRNRPIDEDVINAYARDMNNGVWVRTHQGVAFNDRDELIDGQHRLRAIVKHGAAILMMVTFGLPSVIEGREMTTMDAVDRGRTRSVADQLKIQHGMKDGSAIASISASLGSICYGKRTRRLSVGQTLDIYREFEAATKWVMTHRSKEQTLRKAGMLAAFAFALATEGDFYARHKTCAIAEMHDGLLTGTGLKKGMPITLLREFLTSDDAKLLSRGTDRGLAELVLQAIFMELKGKPIGKLEMGEDGRDFFRGKQKERVDKIAAMFELPEEKR